MGRALALVTVVAFAAASSAVASPTSTNWGIKIGDSFGVRHSQVKCQVASGDGHGGYPMITCFLWRTGQKRPIVGSYGFSIGDLGIVVLRVGKGGRPQVVYTTRFPAGLRGVRSQHDPLKERRVISLRAGDSVVVGNTDLGCLTATDGARPMLACKRVLAAAEYAKADPPVVTLSAGWIRVGGAHIIIAPSGGSFARSQP